MLSSKSSQTHSIHGGSWVDFLEALLKRLTEVSGGKKNDRERFWNLSGGGTSPGVMMVMMMMRGRRVK